MQKIKNFILRALNRIMLLFGYVPDRPSMVFIEVTNLCNSNCIMCPHEKMKRKKGVMDFELFKKAIKQVVDLGVKRVGLYYFGEPLIAPRIIEEIKYAKSAGIKQVWFDTNAFLLNENISNEIVNSGLDKMIISYHGGTKTTYEKNMEGGKFEKTNDNIKSFVNIRNSSYMKKPYITLQATTMENNYGELETIKKNWMNIVDEVRITSVTTLGGSVVDLGKVKGNMKAERRKPCIELWSVLAVLWNGDVTVCCVDYEGRLNLGNINQNSLKELWRSRRLNEMRKLHIRGKMGKIPLCRYCHDYEDEYKMVSYVKDKRIEHKI